MVGQSDLITLPAYPPLLPETAIRVRESRLTSPCPSWHRSEPSWHRSEPQAVQAAVPVGTGILRVAAAMGHNAG